MKNSFMCGAIALLAVSSFAAPLEKRQDFTKITYPPGTGANLPSYPTPPGGYPAPAGGFASVTYPPGTGSNPTFSNPSTFTSAFSFLATPDQVRNGTTNPTATGGLPGALGYYTFNINSQSEIICYNITLVGFKGDYVSPARTATHVHQAARGQNGPPRIAFPNPVPILPNSNTRLSLGCMQGPFTTGLLANGVDTGVGFKLAQIEANPTGFFGDVHSTLAVPGAVRGQFV